MQVWKSGIVIEAAQLPVSSILRVQKRRKCNKRCPEEYAPTPFGSSQPPPSQAPTY